MWNLAFQPLKHISTTIMCMAIKVVTYHKEGPHIKSRVLARSCDKLKRSKLPECKLCAKLCQDGDKPSRSPTLNVSWIFGHLVLPYHMTN